MSGMVSPWLACRILGLLLAPMASALEVPSALGQGLPVTQAAPEPKLYDCQAEADIWQWAWTPDWKAWCCEHESKGCPPTTTELTTQTSTATETLTHSATSTETETETATTTKASTVTDTMTQSGTETTTRTHSAQPVKEAIEAVPEATTTIPLRSSNSAARFESKHSSEQSTSTSLVAASTLPTRQTPSTVPSTETPTTSSDPDLGCNSDCVILGESATCQSRISWVEKHRTNEESAPCPAAHVVVMSQCASCGTCLFKDVKCATKQGVSKSLGERTFMYKYSEDVALRSQLMPQRISAASVVAACIVPLAIATAAAFGYRRRLLDRQLAAEAMDGDLIATIAEE